MYSPCPILLCFIGYISFFYINPLYHHINYFFLGGGGGVGLSGRLKLSGGGLYPLFFIIFLPFPLSLICFSFQRTYLSFKNSIESIFCSGVIKIPSIFKSINLFSRFSLSYSIQAGWYKNTYGLSGLLE